jgi:alkanesulfonate monooxygenase SsuD/methylene tetrahydromethanopterin reductase-like flavin-dependent oxidoreductase (luciferase family)
MASGTKKLRLGAFVLPAASGSPEEYAKTFIGRDPNAYQRALKENALLIRQVEELGFDFVAFSEHHFHAEGFEISNNPILLGAWAAGFTKHLRIGQLGVVLPARNPILVAEDLAMLDQFSGGRMFFGPARGYQQRHVATIGQKYNAQATYATDPEREEHDRINRELFEEHYRIIRAAWENDLLNYQGKHWRIPPPGIFWKHPATLKYAPGMVDPETGELKAVSVVPATVQDPKHIEVMVPFTMTPRTIQWAAREGAKPILFTPIHEYIAQSLDVYQAAAKEAGRELKWGEGVGHFREIVVANTDREAEEISNQGLGFIWCTWHDWFGFNEALRYPGEQGPLPNTPEFVRERGYSIAGSVDTVARKLEALIERYNVELLVPWIFVGPAPIDKLLKSNELLVERVLPMIGVELTRWEPKLRPQYREPYWKEALEQKVAAD